MNGQLSQRFSQRFCSIPLLLAALSLPALDQANADSVVDVPRDVPTIAEALVLVDTGGLIRVAEGTYGGAFTIDKSLTLRGGYPPDFGGDPDPWTYPTMVVGDSAASAIAVVIGTGGGVFIDGVICMGGVAGIDASLAGDASLSLDTVTCQENERGIRADLSETSGLIGNQVFLLNNTLAGAGAGLDAVVSGDAVVALGAATIEGNSATEGGAGARLEVSGNGAVSFTSGTTFTGNGYYHAVGIQAPGTVLYSAADASALLFSSCRIEGNLPAVAGDAAVGGSQTLESLVQIESTEFREAGAQGGEALAAALSGTSALRLVTNSFEGALHLAGPILRVDPSEQAVVHVLRNRIAGNTSAAPLLIAEQSGASFVNLDGNFIRGNTTPGAIFDLHIAPSAAGAFARAINNQVSGNVAVSESGGGRFRIEGPNLAQVGYNTFYHNIAPFGVAGIQLTASDSSPAEISDNAALENLAGGVPADIVAEGFLAHAFSNFLSGDGEPGFADPAAGDFHLLIGSQLIDAGDPDAFQIDHDFEEEDRPFNELADIGSDEFVAIADVHTAAAPTVSRRLLGAVEPNPVRYGRIAFALTLPQDASVVVDLYEPSGRSVARLLGRNLSAGVHRLEWDPEEAGLGSGVYFLRAAAGRTVEVRKLVIAR